MIVQFVTFDTIMRYRYKIVGMGVSGGKPDRIGIEGRGDTGLKGGLVILPSTPPLRGVLIAGSCLALNAVRIPVAPFPLRSTLPPSLANAYAFGTSGRSVT